MPRLDILLKDEAADVVNDYAEDGVPAHEVVRRGLTVQLAAKQARQRGFDHIGFVSDPTKLDIELVGI